MCSRVVNFLSEDFRWMQGVCLYIISLKENCFLSAYCIPLSVCAGEPASTDIQDIQCGKTQAMGVQQEHTQRPRARVMSAQHSLLALNAYLSVAVRCQKKSSVSVTPLICRLSFYILGINSILSLI